MNKIDITVFKNDSNTKVPFSEDNAFNFENMYVSLENANKVFKDYFILSRPLKYSAYNTKRNAKHLCSLYNEDCGWILLDFDKVDNEHNLKCIIDYFSTYSIHIFRSRSRYNCKAFILVDFKTTKDNIRNTLFNLVEELENVCTVDISSSNDASYQAKINEPTTIFFNIGKKLELRNRKQIFNDVNKLQLAPIQDEVDWCRYTFTNKHLATFKQFKNSNGTIQVSLPSEKTPFGYFWDENKPFSLNHPSGKKINIYGEYLKSELYASIQKEKYKKLITDNFKQKNDDSSVCINKKYFSISEDIKHNVLNFLSYKNKAVLKINGIMGSGKSNVISYIKENTSKILFITMRQSLAIDIAKKYDIKNYLDYSVEDNIFGVDESIVVQIDSLYKINIDNYDLIIIDEFISLCIYTNGFLQESFNYVKNIVKLQKLLYSKKLVIIDAFLSNYEDTLLFENRKIFRLYNNYKDDTNVICYQNKNTFIDVIIETAKTTDSVITISITNLTDMAAIKKILEDNGVSVIVITGNSNTHIKKDILKRVEDGTLPFKVFMYSPVITVGVSISGSVSHHFHFDLGNTVDTISSIQMLKRSRSVKAIHVFLRKNKEVYLNTNLQSIMSNLEYDMNKFLTNKNNIVMYDIENECLSNTGIFICKMMSIKNLFNSDYYNTFIRLLNIQFNNVTYIDYKSTSDKLTPTKRSIRKYNKRKISIISNITLDELNTKQHLSSEEMYTYNYLKTKVQIQEQLGIVIKDENTVMQIYKNLKTNINFLSNIRILSYILSDDYISLENYYNYLSINSTSLLQQNIKRRLVFIKNILDLKIFLKTDYTFREVETMPKNVIKILKEFGFRRNITFKLDDIYLELINLFKSQLKKVSNG